MAETWLKSCVKVPYPNPLTRLDQYAATSGVPNGGDPYGNQMLGVVNHSAEGNFGTGNKPIDVMKARGNSWPITIYKSGRKEQHFPLEALAWHAGRKANYRYIGIEHEGKAGEPLTAAQLKATIEVQAEICRIRGWVAIIRNKTGFEHNQFMSTGCPSGRIPWSKIEAGTRASAGVWADIFPISLRNAHLYKDTNLVTLPALLFVKKLTANTDILVTGIWKNSHYISKWSMDNRRSNGFAISATVKPIPPPPPPPPPVPPLAPPPPPPPPVGIWPDVRALSTTVTLYKDTNLVALPGATEVIKALPKNTSIEVAGIWKETHYISRYSFDRKIPNGFAASATVPPADPCAQYKTQIAQLQRQIVDLKGTVVSRDSMIAAQKTNIARLSSRLAQLKQQLQDILTTL